MSTDIPVVTRRRSERLASKPPKSFLPKEDKPSLIDDYIQTYCINHGYTFSHCIQERVPQSIIDNISEEYMSELKYWLDNISNYIENQRILKEEQDEMEQKKQKMEQEYMFIELNKKLEEILDERLENTTEPELVINYTGFDISYINRIVNRWRYNVTKYLQLVNDNILNYINDMRSTLESNNYINYEHFLYECAYRLTLAPIEDGCKVNGYDMYHDVFLYEWDGQRIVFYTDEDGTVSNYIKDDNNFNEPLASFCHNEYVPKYTDNDKLENAYRYRYKSKNLEKDLLKIISYQKPATESKYYRDGPRYNGRIDIAYFIFMLHFRIH